MLEPLGSQVAASVLPALVTRLGHVLCFASCELACINMSQPCCCWHQPVTTLLLLALIITAVLPASAYPLPSAAVPADHP